MSWLDRWWRGGQSVREPDGGEMPVASVGGWRHAFALFGGRRYLTGVPYALPKDDQEISRLDFQHYMLRQLVQGNYAAPLRQPRAILDVGCGTGRWAEEMAAEFPGTQVVAFDLVPPPADAGQLVTQTLSLRPVNYAFVQGSLLDGLPFPDASFEYVHMRFLAGAIPLPSIDPVIRELVRMLAPGGWIELVEPGAFQNAGPSLARLGACGTELTARRGVEPSPGIRIRDWLSVAGIANLACREVLMPVGRHGGRIGQMAAADGLAMMTALRAVVVAQRLASVEEYDAALAGMREELADPSRPSWVPFYFAVGQKRAAHSPSLPLRGTVA